MSNFYMRLLHSHNLMVGQVSLMFNEAFYFTTNLNTYI